MLQYLIQHTIDFFQEIKNTLPPIFIVAIVGGIIQLTKVVIDSVSQKHFSLDQVFSSGGFPSFHTGVASSVTILALLHDGIFSTTFAIAATFSLLFAYDAMNVRFQTGKHAEYLNDIRKELKETFSMKWGKKTKLNERLGHTPIEVLGGLLFGMLLTFVLYYIVYV